MLIRVLELTETKHISVTLGKGERIQLFLRYVGVHYEGMKETRGTSSVSKQLFLSGNVLP
jgi:hypothetical protein